MLMVRDLRMDNSASSGGVHTYQAERLGNRHGTFVCDDDSLYFTRQEHGN